MDTLLRKLDDFEQLLLLSQSDSNVCLFKHVPGLQTKLSEMQDVFDKVDRYHCSLKSNLAKIHFPETRTIYSKSSGPGDFKNDLEFCLACSHTLNTL